MLRLHVISHTTGIYKAREGGASRSRDGEGRGDGEREGNQRRTERRGRRDHEMGKEEAGRLGWEG